MARKPQPGGDRNAWGLVMNEFLDTAHNPDGTIKPAGVQTAVATEVETALAIQVPPAVVDAVAADSTVTAAAAAAIDAEPRVAANTAAVARIDPGTAGVVGQTLTIGPSGPVWLDEPTFNVKHPRFGAKGDYVTDDTAAIQAAITAAKAVGGGVILFPVGHYRISSGPLIIDSHNITFRGVSIEATRITAPSGTGDLFHLNGSPRNIHFQDMYCTANSGHIWKIQLHLTHSSWERVQAVQYSNDHSVLYGDHVDMNYIDNLWLHCQTTHTLAATVPTFFLKGWSVNNNEWSNMRPTYSGNYTWWIESTKAGAWCYDNVFSRITGEVQKGGAVALLGCMGTHFRDFSVWDITGATKHLFLIADSAVGNGTGQTLFTNVRSSATMLAGVYDLGISTGYPTGTTLINCGMNGRPFSVNNSGKRVIRIGGVVTFTENAVNVLIPGNNAPTSVPTGLAIGAYTSGARPAANTVAAGTMLFNTTSNQINVSDGTAWRDATGTLV